MAWIQTFDPNTAEGALKEAHLKQRAQYPPEYGIPTALANSGSAGIVASHSLFPETLYHAFATFGTLLSPDLPLERRHHEMIATVVSVTNRCRY